MAFEKIDSFTIRIEEDIMKYRRMRENYYEVPNKTPEECRSFRLSCMHTEESLFQALIIYYETVLQISKFKSQKEYCKSVLQKLNPSFCEGYFKTSKKK